MTATATDHPAITEPGVYQLTAEQYHADPVAGGSLTSTGARRLLPPSCPAMYRYEADHGQEHKQVWDIGHAAHLLVLGSGPEFVVIDADSYRTKDAKQARDDAYSDGKVPLLAYEYEQVGAMAAAIRQHPIASTLFDPDHGNAEQTLVWRDPATGLMCRARLDWLRVPAPGRRLIIPDYKTCASADPEALSRSVATFGYHQQAAWYLAGAQALGLAGPDAAFLFVAQEKRPPHLVSVIELDHVALRIGADRNRRALDVYAHCRDTGEWPPYVDGVGLISLPRWAEVAEGAHLP